MKNEFIKAGEVMIGDNVWEHNIVTSIKEVREHNSSTKYLLFNGESVSPWFASITEEVMVTNR